MPVAARRLGPAALAVAALAAAACGGDATPEAPPVNVVVYLVDTLRADRLGVYGYPKPTTPALDRLAKDAVVFENAYAPAPWTLPSVVSLMTPTWPCEHGVVLDGDRVADSLVPLAARLQQAGYATGAFLANAFAGEMSGLDRGFDHSESVLGRWTWTPRAWLEERGDEPFFLYVHQVETHDPYFAPPRIRALFGYVPPATRVELRDALRSLRRLTRFDFDRGLAPGTTDNTEAQRAQMRAVAAHADSLALAYDAAARFADRRLALTLRALEDLGLWDRTLFVFLSDHGEEFGEHGGWQHDHSVYEELVRSPLVVRFPGNEFGGRRVREPVSLVDVGPTILDQLERPGLAEPIRGRSLLPAIRGERDPGPDGPQVRALRINRKKYFRPFDETRGDVNLVVRDGRWKGIWNAEPDFLELYDLEADPGETRDVGAAHPERVARLRGFARQWLSDCRARATPAVRAREEGPGEAAIGELRALGYVE